MRTKAEIISFLTNPGVIAIVRAPKAVPLASLAEALLVGGVSAVEITMTTPGAIAAIREARQKVGDRAAVGVGSVIDVETCHAALDAGAEFVVSPICRPGLAAVANAAQRPIMLGAYTPTEAQLAHEAGSDFIKIFPADGLGPAYVKALRAPLPHLRIVPTGGVDVNNIADFFKAGCAAVGVGSSLVPVKLLQEGNWPEVTRRASELVNAVRLARQKG